MDAPTLPDAQEVCKKIPLQDLLKLRTWITVEELPRRDAQAKIDQAIAEQVESLWEAHPDLKPDFEERDVEVVVDGKATVEEIVAAYPAWKRPLGSFDSYPPGARVAYKGDVWRNDLGIVNDFEPEEGNPHTRWSRVTDELLLAAGGGDAGEEPAAPGASDIAPWEQKQGAHDAYKAGDKVEWKGNIYEAVATTTYSPDGYPPHWRKLD